MFRVTSNQGETVKRFYGRDGNMIEDYVRSLTGSYSIEQLYGYNALTDEYYVRWTQDEHPGKVYYLSSKNETVIAQKAGQVELYVNTHLLEV